MSESTIFFVMGVSGCGKTTIGKLLAKKFDLPYFDGDDFHPKANVLKMSKGQPLNDLDRQGWLESLNKLAVENIQVGAVIACSALKQIYRETLKNQIEESVRFVYLEGTFEVIHERMQRRKGHFMPAGLLKSQFKSLQPPEDAITATISGSPENILQNILDQL